jgi:hypothetical protein
MLDERFMYLAAFLIAWGGYSYIQDLRKDAAKPNLVTWFLWSVAPLIAFSAQIQASVGPAAFLTLMVGLCPLAVFIAGLRRGTFRPTRFDMLCGSASVVALVLWQLTGNGSVAVALSVVADGLAAAPTIKKAYQDPTSESPFLFMLFAVSALIALLTIKTWTFEAAGFSVYILLLYITLYTLVKTEVGIRLARTEPQKS